MQLQYSTQDLISQISSMCISTLQTTQAPRVANSLLAVSMPHQLNPGHLSQYNQLYLDRLAKLRGRIRLPGLRRIDEVDESLGEISVVGVFKRLEFRRVRAFEKRFNDYYREARTIFDEKDGLELEDQTGKLKFSLTPDATMNGKPIRPTDLPYGVVVALTGRHINQKMQFVASLITLPAFAPQVPLRVTQSPAPRKFVFMSAPSLQQTRNMLWYLNETNNQLVSCVFQGVVIMGFSSKLTAKQYQELDQMLVVHGTHLDIFVMPNDRINRVYPHRHIHRVALPQSSQKVSLVQNPQIFVSSPPGLDGTPAEPQLADLNSILVCCGENIQDLIKNCSYGQCSLDTMESVLEYSHLAPTSPFSLKCEMMPQDHLVMESLPNVFVAGECERTEFRHYQPPNTRLAVTLVSVARGEAVVLDVGDFRVERLYTNIN